MDSGGGNCSFIKFIQYPRLIVAADKSSSAGLLPRIFFLPNLSDVNASGGNVGRNEDLLVSGAESVDYCGALFDSQLSTQHRNAVAFLTQLPCQPRCSLASMAKYDRLKENREKWISYKT